MRAWVNEYETPVEGHAAAQRINGNSYAAGLRERVAAAFRALSAAAGRALGLAAVLVGADPASDVHVHSNGKATKKAAMLSVEHRLPADATRDQMLTVVQALNRDAGIDGIQVQLPLPSQIDDAAIILATDPDKDVDCFYVLNAGRLATGVEGFVPTAGQGADHVGAQVMLGGAAGLAPVQTSAVDVSCTPWQGEQDLVFAGLRGFETACAAVDVPTAEFSEIWVSSTDTFGGPISPDAAPSMVHESAVFVPSFADT